MSKIDSSLDFMSEGYTDINQIAEKTGRLYGMSAVDVLEERERRRDILKYLGVVLKHLTDTQKDVLLLIGSGVKRTDIADELGLPKQNVYDTYKSISKRLDEAVSEDRICFLQKEVERLSKTSRGRHSKLYKDLRDELDERYELREALKELFVLLTPPESRKEMDGKVNMPAYPFERAMDVNCGMREGIQDGVRVMKTVSKCFMPEYMDDTFGKRVCCTLCATCKRKKDVVGRRDHGIYGIEKHI